MKTKILLITLLFNLSACSYLTTIMSEDDEIVESKSSNSQTLCIPSKSSKIEIVGSNNYVAEQYNEFIEALPSERPSFLDKAIMWSLLQMSVRPDLATPNSRLIVVAKINGKELFLDNFSTDKNALSFLAAIEKVRSEYRGKKSLATLGKIIDKSFPKHIQVDKGLELFIKNNRSKLLKKKSFAKTFFRGKQGLRKGESYKRLRYTPLISDLKRSRAVTTTDTHLFKIDGFSNKLWCNYDLGIYKHSIFINTDNNKKSLPFGLSDNSGNYFIALSSISYDEIKSYKKTYLLTGNSSSAYRPAYCSYKGTTSSFGLISAKGRDPGQLLHSILEKKIPTSKSDINKLFKDGRLLELLNPSRVVLESKRAGQSSLAKLREDNMRVYHANKIGDLLGIVDSNRKYESGFVTDDRNEQTIFCK